MADQDRPAGAAPEDQPREHGAADAGVHRQNRTTRSDFDNRLTVAADDDPVGPNPRRLAPAVALPATQAAAPDQEGARTRPREADRVGHPSVYGGTGRTARRGDLGTGPTDPGIQDAVCERLAQLPDLDPTDVLVSVQDGRVVLDGTVPAPHMHVRLADLANDVEGVVAVDNRVQVQTAPGEPFRTQGERANRHF